VEVDDSELRIRGIAAALHPADEVNSLGLNLEKFELLKLLP